MSFNLSVYVISIYTAGVRRSLLLVTYSRNIAFIGRANRFKIQVRCVAKNNCSKEMIYKPFFRQAMERRNFTKPHGVMNWMRVCEHVINCLDICLQVRFLSDTFQASIVSFFENILFNSTL